MLPPTLTSAIVLNPAGPNHLFRIAKGGIMCIEDLGRITHFAAHDHLRRYGMKGDSIKRPGIFPETDSWGRSDPTP